MSIRKPAGKYNVKIVKSPGPGLVSPITRADYGAIVMIQKGAQFDVGPNFDFLRPLVFRIRLQRPTTSGEMR